MFVKYGDFEHEAKDVSLSGTGKIIRTAWGYPISVLYQISGTGMIFGDTQSELIDNIEEALAAYTVDNQDFALYFNDGTVTPDIDIRAADTLDGVRVVNRPFLNPRTAANYSTYWEYAFSIEANVRLESSNTPILMDFDETLEFVGTGRSKKVFVEKKRGPAQRQRPRTNTLCRATQSGFTVGLNGYIQPPFPRWFDLLDEESYRVIPKKPKRTRNGFMEYRIDYSYQFISATPFGLSFPNLTP